MKPPILVKRSAEVIGARVCRQLLSDNGSVVGIGNRIPILPMDSISCLKEELGIDAIKQFEPKQTRDVEATAANTNTFEEWVSFKPATPLKRRVTVFAHWYQDYHKR